MSEFVLEHLSDDQLLQDLADLVARERLTTARLLAHIAETDHRRLYLPAACPSMYAYCVRRLRFSEQAALKRIYAARIARQFPTIFQALADGRLHLSAIGLLGPHLTRENADDLLAAAANRTKAEIEVVLAERFPKTESLDWIEDLEVQGPVGTATGPSKTAASPQGAESRHGTEGRVDPQLSPGRVAVHTSGGARCHRASRQPAPIARGRFTLQVSISASMRDKLRHASDLLAHRIPSRDMAQVLECGLDALIRQLEKRKYATTPKPGRSAHRAASPRTIPASVRRAVRARDEGRCTFVSRDGARCPARALLEFDHVVPVARGGTATADNIRLRCRAHNQFEAERVFGAPFMREKRRARTCAPEDQDVVACLRTLGFSASEARRAAEASAVPSDTPLEERVRMALGRTPRPPARTLPAP